MTHTNTSILVVDDEEANRDILTRRLLREGYTVAQAADGRQALNMMNFERYDLVLLDIMMPVMDGFEVLLNIKTNARYNNTPVIMLSAMDDQFSIDRCQSLGAFDYVTKPCELNALKARMWRCFFELKLARNIGLAQHSQRSILIVEDNELNLDLLARRIKMLGHTALTATNGKEALALLDEQSIDLMLLDIMMPQMDGCELLQTVRSRQRHNDVPIIMVSALGDNASLERCISLGSDDYVLKPYNAVILKDRINRALNLRDARLQGQDEARLQAPKHSTDN